MADWPVAFMLVGMCWAGAWMIVQVARVAHQDTPLPRITLIRDDLHDRLDELEGTIRCWKDQGYLSAFITADDALDLIEIIRESTTLR